MSSGMTIGLAALGCWIAFAFLPAMQMEDETVLRVVMWPTNWSCLMMLVGALLMLPLHDGWGWWLRASTFWLLALLAMFIAAAFTLYPARSTAYGPYGWDENAWERQRNYEVAAFKIGGALSLIAAAALLTTIIAGVMRALSGRSAESELEQSPYWLQCPRCGREQQAHTGEYHCAQCRLRTKVVLT
jgi:Zn finger protein HypA/HybF involved in hydrogenase expression